MYSMFNENGIYDNGSYLCLDICNINKAVEYVKRNKVESIFIGNFTEKKYEVDLKFVKKLPFIRKLYISSNLLNIYDIEALYSLEKLEDLVWFCEESINIEKFINLKSLAITYLENIKFYSSTVTKLEVSYLESIENILGIENLELLTLRFYQGKNIEHLNKFKSLNSLTIKVAKKLFNIDSLKKCSKIKTLELEKIKKDLELEPLSRCDNLERLYIYNKIENCNFIKSMKSINLFLCQEILSGDLDPMFKNNNLKNAKLIGYKKYYSYSKKEFESRFDSW